MKKKTSNILLYGFLAILLIAGIIFSANNGLFSITSVEEKSFFLKHDIGSVTGEDRFYDWWGYSTQDDIFSNIANINDYRIEVTKWNTHKVFVGCEDTDYEGTFVSFAQDDNNCDMITYNTISRISSWKDVRSYTSSTACQKYCPGDARDDGYNQWRCDRDDCEGRVYYPSVEKIVGGSIINDEEGCFSQHLVYYKDTLIHDTGVIDGLVNVNLGELAPASADNLYAQFHKSEQYEGSYDKCYWVENLYSFQIPEDNFDFDTSVPKDVYFRGEEAEVTIDFTNDYQDLNGQLDVTARLPLNIFQQPKNFTVTQTDILTIPKGENQYVYNIPTEEVTNNLYITPRLTVRLEKDKISGVNANCPSDKQVWQKYPDGERKAEVDSIFIPIQECDSLIDILYITGEEFKIIVDPTPVELNERLERLNLELSDTLLIIEALNSTLQEQKAILQQINLSVEETAILIEELTNKANEQAELITSLQYNIDEQAEIINNMENSLQEKQEIITNLQLTLDEQAELIDSMELSVQEKANLIVQLSDSISNQNVRIAGLEQNLAYKVELIGRLEVTNQEQAELIEAMELSFADQGIIVSELKLTVSEDAELIQALTNDNQEQAQIIDSLELENDELRLLLDEMELSAQQEAELIANLRLNNDEMAALIVDLNLKADEQALILSELKGNNEDMSSIINKMALENKELIDLVSQLKLNNEEMEALVELLNADLETKQGILDAYGKNQMTKVYVVLIVFALMIIGAIWYYRRTK